MIISHIIEKLVDKSIIIIENIIVESFDMIATDYNVYRRLIIKDNVQINFKCIILSVDTVKKIRKIHPLFMLNGYLYALLMLSIRSIGMRYADRDRRLRHRNFKFINHQVQFVKNPRLKQTRIQILLDWSSENNDTTFTQ